MSQLGLECRENLWVYIHLPPHALLFPLHLGPSWRPRLGLGPCTPQLVPCAGGRGTPSSRLCQRDGCQGCRLLAPQPCSFPPVFPFRPVAPSGCHVCATRVSASVPTRPGRSLQSCAAAPLPGPGPSPPAQRQLLVGQPQDSRRGLSGYEVQGLRDSAWPTFAPSPVTRGQSYSEGREGKWAECVKKVRYLLLRFTVPNVT